MQQISDHDQLSALWSIPLEDKAAQQYVVDALVASANNSICILLQKSTFFANIVSDETRAIMVSPKAFDLIIGTLSNGDAVGHYAVLCMVNELLKYGMFTS